MNGATPLGPRVVMPSRTRPRIAACTAARCSENTRWRRTSEPAGTNCAPITPATTRTKSGVTNPEPAPHPVTRRDSSAQALENDDALKKIHPRQTNWKVQNRCHPARQAPWATAGGPRAIRRLPADAQGAWRAGWQRFWTFQFVCLGWIFFNASSFSNAWALLSRLVTGWGAGSGLVTPLLVLVVAGVIGAQFVPAGSLVRLQRVFSEQRAAVQAAILGLVLLGITTLGPSGV